ncbi:MAG: hypothetical protein J3K34DRAFT_477906 [Monoraphidium minutum]|nr:MAG: hypothetical protein J3K34DRAFT_477906 [Monoraphidium minutum]
MSSGRQKLISDINVGGALTSLITAEAVCLGLGGAMVPRVQGGSVTRSTGEHSVSSAATARVNMNLKHIYLTNKHAKRRSRREMGPKSAPLRGPSRRAASSMPEMTNFEFLTEAARHMAATTPAVAAHLGQRALQLAGGRQLPVPPRAAQRLCARCGTPTVAGACSAARVVRLGAAAAARLSKDLPRRGGVQQRNQAAAVRTCGVSSVAKVAAVVAAAAGVARGSPAAAPELVAAAEQGTAASDVAEAAAAASVAAATAAAAEAAEAAGAAPTAAGVAARQEQPRAQLRLARSSLGRSLFAASPVPLPLPLPHGAAVTPLGPAAPGAAARLTWAPWPAAPPPLSGAAEAGARCEVVFVEGHAAELGGDTGGPRLQQQKRDARREGSTQQPAQLAAVAPSAAAPAAMAAPPLKRRRADDAAAVPRPAAPAGAAAEPALAKPPSRAAAAPAAGAAGKGEAAGAVAVAAAAGGCSGGGDDDAVLAELRLALARRRRAEAGGGGKRPLAAGAGGCAPQPGAAAEGPRQLGARAQRGVAKRGRREAEGRAEAQPGEPPRQQGQPEAAHDAAPKRRRREAALAGATAREAGAPAPEPPPQPQRQQQRQPQQQHTDERGAGPQHAEQGRKQAAPGGRAFAVECSGAGAPALVPPDPTPEPAPDEGPGGPRRAGKEARRRRQQQQRRGQAAPAAVVVPGPLLAHMSHKRAGRKALGRARLFGGM